MKHVLEYKPHFACRYVPGIIHDSRRGIIHDSRPPKDMVGARVHDALGQ